MSKIITPRMRWCLGRIQECFHVEESVVEVAIQDSANFEALKAVLQNEDRGQRMRVFVYYQPVFELNELNEWVQTSKGPQLLFTDGADHKVRLRGLKACYFLRMGFVNNDIPCDKNLLYGEVGADALKSLEVTLSRMFQPLCEVREDWGKIEQDQLAEFLETCEKVGGDLQDSIKSALDGLELRKPDKRFETDHRSAQHRSREDPELVQHFEELLEEWCARIEGYLQEDSTTYDSTSEAGPLTELEYWRRRMQRLTSVTEQLKTKECKMVLNVLSSLTKNPQDSHYQTVFALLRRWKQIDINITEAANEAKDNVKYLFTLEKFIEPLYSGKPAAIVDTLPALMNSIKMIHTIARYYNTTERMTTLFVKITNQMIVSVKQCILEPNDDLWAQDPQMLVQNLESCLKLHESYQENYRITKDKLLAMPKGKQFDFSEQQIFGKFDLFCRRIIKLMDMFSTIHQFRALASHNLEGMEELIQQFQSIITAFRAKKHDLLDFHNNKFDRDYVEFNVAISELEGSLQQFINESFESITSIEASLTLLKKFQTILQRDNLKSDLDSKFNIIFQNYGFELEIVQQLYEKHKHAPPIPRNLPPVSGNIMWSRHLLKRIEEPMKKFESNQNVLSTKDAKRIIKTYNKVARTLVAFEYLWFQAWQQSIETAKAGLQATLIIRHPDDNCLYVNFDQEILQLIREAKCLDRMGIEIPESAKIVLLQESKFKSYFNDLQYALKEYERVTKRVIPVAAKLLEPHIRDMEYKLRPGMITLTWTSMNIDAYKHHIHSGLKKLEELVTNINDIIENRIEKNLKLVSKCVLVDLPTDRSTQLNEFVALQEKRIAVQSRFLNGKNVEIENAVADLIKLVCSYPLDPHIKPVNQETIDKITMEYRHKMYCALLKCTKASLGMVKERVGSHRGAGGFLFIERPFFEIFVNLQTPKVQITPDLEDVQRAINKSALAVLKCTKSLYDWNQGDLPDAEKATFFDEITRDLQIAVVCLLLTGSIQGLKTQVNNYLQRFYKYQWLWCDDKDRAYAKFMASKPSLSQYESKLLEFQEVDKQIDGITSIHVIGAMSINTSTLKNNLRYEVQTWKLTFSKFLHNQAKKDMSDLYDYMKYTEQRLKRGEKIKMLIQSDNTSSASNSDVLQELSKIMEVLKEIRERESGIEQEIAPVLDMYAMLERFIGPQGLGDEENDQKEVLRHKWGALVDYAEKVTDELGELQENFKRKLLKDIKEFANDVNIFRNDFVANGPIVPGIRPKLAVDRLRRYHEEFEIRERKFHLYRSGEELFALQPTEYPELIKTKKELALLDQLYGLYTDVIDTIEDWKQIEWEKVRDEINLMDERVETFAERCRKMPPRLRDWDAYKDLKKQIDNFQVVLPLLKSLAKPSIMQRHWTEVSNRCGKRLVITPDFRLQTLLETDLVSVAEEIEEICDGADKQLAIQTKIAEIAEVWQLRSFEFVAWKSRGIPIFQNVVPIVEELEDAQVQLQTMITMRHVAPFKEEAQAMLNNLSDTSETLERWLKVQMLWCSLESVFTGGDIAKQLPSEAKKFHKIDKDFDKVMRKAKEVGNVVQSTQNDILKQSLVVFYNELEKCQKSLEGYLEQKRAKFPRFYFVSNMVLLQILSRGQDPQAIQPFYEKIFDSVDQVVHDPEDKNRITSIISRLGEDEEIVPLHESVQCKGSIEEWLTNLLHMQRLTLKSVFKDCARRLGEMQDAAKVVPFLDSLCAQASLIALQLSWTKDCTDALHGCRSKKTIMKETAQRASTVLSKLIGWTLGTVESRLKRRMIEALITAQVHHRDVITDLANLHKHKKVSDVSDFEWQKHMRFYWVSGGHDDLNEDSEDGTLSVSLTDVDLKHSYEYLGCSGRLVVTPLVERCHVALAHALGMCYGGTLVGPAGGGKTEIVKDLGKRLGVFVVVHNCSDKMSFANIGKILKGLCQSGLWGCLDDFNRVTLPVLSVISQQILSIQQAKKASKSSFLFPGDASNCSLNANCNIFATINPAFSSRSQLPANLKMLFRNIAVVPADLDVIIRVKLCASGYTNYPSLSHKFAQVYAACRDQLSQQNHYDFGLRNMLVVLEACAESKRKEADQPEDQLVVRALRSLNLPELVEDDIPLFLGLLVDTFPKHRVSLDATPSLAESMIKETVESRGLLASSGWREKALQLHDMQARRHGIMVVGPSGSGKTEIINVVAAACTALQEVNHKISRIHPKSVRAADLYGESDPSTGEWTTGILASLFAKMNQRSNKFKTWLVCDGPVDGEWVEDLNSVLDKNRILTLANGDRVLMADQNRILFEVDALFNASPATISRTGIVCLAEHTLDWQALTTCWVTKMGPSETSDFIATLVTKWLAPAPVSTSADAPMENADAVKYASTLAKVMSISAVGVVSSLIRFMDAMLAKVELSDTTVEMEQEVERLFLLALIWSVGATLDVVGRQQLDAHLRAVDAEALPETDSEYPTIFNFGVDLESLCWQPWRADESEVLAETSTGADLDLMRLYVPTVESSRAAFIIDTLHECGHPVLMVGANGTGKTTTALMYLTAFDSSERVSKRIKLSSATEPRQLQNAIEGELDKRGGKNFGPSQGKKMTFFLDDLSMPAMNQYGDRPTLEFARQLVEFNSFSFLEKDKRGDRKVCEEIQFIAAMQNPTAGRPDIPDRLKRHLLVFYMEPLSAASVDDIYSQILSLRFDQEELSSAAQDVVAKLSRATAELWQRLGQRFLPTPSKFHYRFTLRDVSRVFQGICACPSSTFICEESEDASIMLKLWRHECERVFCDKLVDIVDKDKYYNTVQEVLEMGFDREVAQLVKRQAEPAELFTAFAIDEATEANPEKEELDASTACDSVYEEAGDVDALRQHVYELVAKHNAEAEAMPIKLVILDEALFHLVRLVRIINLPQGHALVVGAHGSGRQSLARLAVYIAKQELFQVSMCKDYVLENLLDDLRRVYRMAGHELKKVTCVFTDRVACNEELLEVIHTMLSTGEIPGLFSKEEMLGLTADLEPYAAKHKPKAVTNLTQYFFELCRDNIHIILCTSPEYTALAERVRRFPGILDYCTIDWHLEWSSQTLKELGSAFMKDCSIREEESMAVELVSAIHSIARETSEEYAQRTKRRVYQTPNSYLSFLSNMSATLETNQKAFAESAERVKIGLEKLDQAASDVEALSTTLQAEKIKLATAANETSAMIGDLEAKSLEATQGQDKVSRIQERLDTGQARVDESRKDIEARLGDSKAAVEEAAAALSSIKPVQLNEVKKSVKNPDILKLIFDTLLLLFHHPMNPVKHATVSIKKHSVSFIEHSYNFSQQRLVSNPGFLQLLHGLLDKGLGMVNCLNPETLELLAPYLDLDYFTPSAAKGGSGVGESLCTYVTAVVSFYKACVPYKTELDAFAVEELNMWSAKQRLDAATAKLNTCKESLSSLQERFDNKLREKAKIEESTKSLQRKIDNACGLIDGLASERIQWENRKTDIVALQQRLVGDSIIAAAFLTYCGPFDEEVRTQMLTQLFRKAAANLSISTSEELDVAQYLKKGAEYVTQLDANNLVIQNTILVKQPKARCSLLIDPQGQALEWLMEVESRAGRLASFGVVQPNSPNLRDCLELSLCDGMTMIISQVEETLDPLLDPVLAKEVVKRGRSLFIPVADKLCPYHPDFTLYLVTKLPNPHFAAELQAKVNIVDMSVTMKTLESTLLDRVISKEQKAMFEQLELVQDDIRVTRKQLESTADSLLMKLSCANGSLLDDCELIQELKSVKDTVDKMAAKLADANQTRITINEKRVQYKPIAIRGAVLYFSLVELFSINCMYQTSLAQFLSLFGKSLEEETSSKTNSVSKRVAQVIDTLTYKVYRYVNRGLYEPDKLTFVFTIAVKLLLSGGVITIKDLTAFLKGGAVLDIEKTRKKPCQWLSDDAWLNVVALSAHCKFFRTLPDDITRNEASWKQWVDDDYPEVADIPDYEDKLAMNLSLSAWYRLQLIRALRTDRTVLCVRNFIRTTPELGERYVEPVTDVLETVVDDIDHLTPAIFLLSEGADPTESLQALRYRRKKNMALIPMGPGQRQVAITAIQQSMRTGNWVLLQNCELALGFMNELQDILPSLREQHAEDRQTLAEHRLFLTTTPHPKFPLGLIHSCIKVANDSPAGVRAKLLRNYTLLIDQDRIERVDSDAWRQLLYSLSFLHSIMQERKKFGPIGWSVPYEYSPVDITACLDFLSRHLYLTNPSWSAIQYMVDIHYGSQVQDSMDKRIFETYCSMWITEKSLGQHFTLNTEGAKEFSYTIPNSTEHREYVKHIQGLPEEEHSDLFGLHQNIDLNYRIESATALLTALTCVEDDPVPFTITNTEADVKSKCSELLATMPDDFHIDEVKENLAKHGGVVSPMNAFILQEIVALHEVITKVRRDLLHLQSAMYGDIMITRELEVVAEKVYGGDVPSTWMVSPGGAEFSWFSSSFAKWFDGLSRRYAQLNACIGAHRPHTYWLAGFNNPAGFLQSVKQEVTRQHESEGWALDDMVYQTEMSDFTNEDAVKSNAKEGVYIHGLMLTGAAWDGKATGSLAEAEPKKLYCPLPVMSVTAVTKKVKAENVANYGPYGPYECPLYKYSTRTDAQLVATVDLATKERKPAHWVLRGVALVCSCESVQSGGKS